MVQDPTGDQRRPVETHSAMREDAVPVADQVRAERRHRFEPRQVRKLLIENREVDVKAGARRRRNALVQPPFQVDQLPAETLRRLTT